MTVSSTTLRSGPYSGNGSTTSFPYAFRVLDASHLKVVRTTAGGAQTVDPGQYTVSGVNDANGGAITFAAAPPVGASFTILRNVPFTQELDLENQGAFAAESIERSLDLAVMRDLQMLEIVSAGSGGGVAPGGSITIGDVIGLSGALNDRQAKSERNQPGGYAGLTSGGKIPLSLLPESEGGTASIIDFPTRQAAMDADIEDGTLFIRTSGFAAPGDGGGSTYVPSATEPSGVAAAKLRSADGQWWRLAGRNRSVFAFGVVGDGVTDDTAAFQGMVNAGGLIVIPDQVTIRLTAPIVVYQPVTILGSGCVPYKALNENGQNVRGPGSWFFLDHLGVGFSFVGVSAPNSTSGMAVQRMVGVGTFRNQPIPSGGTFTPLAADWDIVVTDMEFELDDFVFLNPTKALAADLNRGGRMRLNNVRGQPLSRGISIDRCFDVVHMDVHFWPYWSLHAAVKAYTWANLQALITGRVDGLMAQRFFTIFANIAWLVVNNGSGSLNRARMDWAYLDVCTKGLVVNPNVTLATIDCDNLTVYGRSDTSSIGIQLSGSNTRLTAGFMDLEEFQNQALYIDGSSNRVQTSKLKISKAGIANNSTPACFVGANNALYVDGAKDWTTYNGNAFKAGAGTLVEGGAGGTPTPTPDPNATVYSPSLTTGNGTTPSVQVQAFYYLKDGNQVTIWYDITFGSSVGTGGFGFSLPFTPFTTAVGLGRNQSDGQMNQILCQGNNNTAYVYRFDNQHPMGTNQRLGGTLTYAVG